MAMRFAMGLVSRSTPLKLAFFELKMMVNSNFERGATNLDISLCHNEGFPKDASRASQYLVV